MFLLHSFMYLFLPHLSVSSIIIRIFCLYYSLFPSFLHIFFPSYGGKVTTRKTKT
jgi:hypothetical protein